MSEEKNKPGDPSHEGFEREDLGTKGIVTSLVGLAPVCILIYFVVLGVYRGLDWYARKTQKAASPLVTVTANPEVRRAMPYGQTQEEINKTFPVPRLEENERQEIKDFRLQEENTLNSYGWVDQKTGVVRIPIERAMELTAQRGLSVTPRVGTVPPAAATATDQTAQRPGAIGKPEDSGNKGKE